MPWDSTDVRRDEDEPNPTSALVDAIYSALAAKEWEEAFKLMDALIGAMGAARWLSIELERACMIPPLRERSSGASRSKPGQGPRGRIEKFYAEGR